MERIVKVHIERLPEGVYLATSDEVQGLVAQGRTITETLEIARDVAQKLLEAQAGRNGSVRIRIAAGSATDSGYPHWHSFLLGPSRQRYNPASGSSLSPPEK